MLINATQAEEVRVAIVSGSTLENLDTDTGKEPEKSSIFKGEITRIERSLEAVFVNYGGVRHGFLPFREINPSYLKPSNGDDAEKSSIGDRLEVGQKLIIQVEKESRGNKGAALTTFISLAGCYLVLMPKNPNAGGISRRIDGDERAELREVLNELNIPDGMGVIVRTAGMGRDIKDLQWDLDVLVRQWQSIEQAANERPAPFLIYQESNVVVRAIRDHLRPDINEILIDSPKVYEEVCNHVRMMRPDYISRVKLYNDSIPLFSRFQIESQIEMAMQREVRLPSGGTIVIDHTEALISIDINSARATKGGDIEETALHTNLEAASEIARQLRLRDIGGLIVIDFIDMNVQRNQREVEQRLKDALAFDRARVQVGKISRFGLLEMSRQRLRPSLSSAREVVCPRCSGQGTIRGIEILALNMIRLTEEEAIKDGTSQVVLEAPTEVITYLINEKRQAVLELERKHHVRIILLPSQHMVTPNYIISRMKKDDSDQPQNEPASYTLATKLDNTKNQYVNPLPVKTNQPAVSNVSMEMAPQRKGIISRFLKSILGSEQSAGVSSSAEKNPETPSLDQNRGRRNNNQRRTPNNRDRRGPNTRNNNNRNRPPRTGEEVAAAEHQPHSTQPRQHQPRPQRTHEPRTQNEPRVNETPSEPRALLPFELRELAKAKAKAEVDGNIEQVVVETEIVDVNGNTTTTNPNQTQRKRRPGRRHHYRKSRGNRPANAGENAGAEGGGSSNEGSSADSGSNRAPSNSEVEG